MKVSAIVPVYNPGSNIDDCIESLLGQSLPADEYEAIFVDDGSTDDTPARLDELAERHRNVRVAHIPNSGWPGRPRNIGIDMAAGEYVYFIDNDDWIGPEALERLYARAVRDEADVVVGKVVGHGRQTSRPLFRRNRHGLRIDSPLLLGMLTPHKLFRRALLQEHGIRFPEGRVRLEDHVFVVHAYLHARSISILADYPCYHWVLRSHETNASSGKLDPVGYYQNLRDVLDIVDEHLEPGPLRDRLYAHWYRTKMLSRVGGPRNSPYGREVYREIRRLALERFGEGAERDLSFPMRLRAALLRDDRGDALARLGRFERDLRGRVRLLSAGTADGKQELRLRAGVAGLRFERRGERILLAPPDELAGALPESRLDATEPVGASKLDLVLRSQRHGEFLKRAKSKLVLDGAGDAVEPALDAHVTFDPRKVAAGRALDAGEWQVLARVTVAGWQVEAPVRHRVLRTPLVLRVEGDGGARLAGAPVAALRRFAGRSYARLRRRLRRSGLLRPQ